MIEKSTATKLEALRALRSIRMYKSYWGLLGLITPINAHIRLLSKDG